MKIRSIFVGFILSVTLLGHAAHSAIAEEGSGKFSISEKIVIPDGVWDYVTIDGDHRRLYLSRADGIDALDLVSGKLMPKIVSADHTHVALPVNGGRDLLVTVAGEGAVKIYDLGTGQARAVIKTGSKPDNGIVDSASGKVFVMDHGGGGIAIIDPVAGRLVSRIPLEGKLEAAALDGQGRLFVNVKDLDLVDVVDLASGTLLAQYPIVGCAAPTGIAYIHESGEIVTACTNGVAEFLDARSGHQIKTIKIGQGPDTIIYDQRRKVILIPCGVDGNLYEISLTAHEIVGVSAAQVTARTGAIDSATGTVYLPAASVADGSATDDKVQAKPGSFVLLVMRTNVEAP